MPVQNAPTMSHAAGVGMSSIAPATTTASPIGCTFARMSARPMPTVAMAAAAWAIAVTAP